MAASYRNITNQNGVAELAQTRKVNKYAPLTERFHFLPLASETLGGWATEAVIFLDILGKRLISETNEPRAKNFLYQRLSVAIQRGNSKAVLEGFKPGERLNEIDMM